LTGRATPGVRSESRELPPRPDAPRVRSALGTALLLWVSDRTLRFLEGPDAPVVNPNTRVPDSCEELTGHVRSNRDRVRCSVRSPWWPPFAYVSFLTSGVVENRRFTSPKSAESRRACECANSTKCTPPSACVLTFHKHFSRRYVSSQLDPNAYDQDIDLVTLDSRANRDYLS
jgi:hypothetical protein